MDSLVEVLVKGLARAVVLVVVVYLAHVDV